MQTTFQEPPPAPSASWLAREYEAAKSLAEQRFTMLRRDIGDERVLLRYVRALRRCERLRLQLAAIVNGGAA